MYALFEIKGKQYKAEKGSTIKIDKINTEKGEKLEFDSVLMVSDDNEVKVGAPYVAGAKVTAVVEDHARDSKVVVFKFKRRKNYSKKYGHRQPYTTIKIDEITN